MTTNIQYLETRLAAACKELSEINSTKAGGLPNATGAGVNVDHQGYKAKLIDEIERLKKIIGDLSIGEEGPLDVETQYVV